MITASNISLSYGTQVLFKEVNLKFTPGNCYGIIGANGAGKSTFLKILSGDIEPDTGEIVITPGERLATLKQDHFKYNEYKVLDTVIMGYKHLYDVMQERDAIYSKEDFSEEDGLRAAELEGEFSELGGWEAEANASQMLDGLGIPVALHDKKMSEIEDNLKVRVLLAQALFGNPDILLLDEPTNHLDIESIQWLEQFLASSSSALLLVSHDKAFLDAVTTRTIEISLGRIYDYKANYSKYLELRAEQREQQLRAFENQQKMIADTEDFIERFRYKATKAVQVQSRIKQLEKLQRIEVDEEDNSALRLKFPPAPHSGVLPVDIEALTKKYDSLLVLDNIDMQISRGEKVAFVGKNGEGKSTLVKCIMNEVEYSGKLKLGHGVKIGYFAQNQASLLDENLTVFETVDYAAVGDIRTKIRDILGAFMFGGAASDKKVKVLSGGERSRLAMIKLLLEPANLLILDEPTNHLDMRSKDVLKEAIRAFDGTVILVSHDRDFLDGLVNKVYEFANHKVKLHLGGIKEFLEEKKIDNLKEIERRAVTTECKSSDNTPSENKLAYEARKELSKKIKKIERSIADTEKEIEQLENLLADIEAKFAEGNSSESLVMEYNSKKHLLDQKMYEWEIQNEEIEQLKSM